MRKRILLSLCLILSLLVTPCYADDRVFIDGPYCDGFPKLPEGTDVNGEGTPYAGLIVDHLIDGVETNSWTIQQYEGTYEIVFPYPIDIYEMYDLQRVGAGSRYATVYVYDENDSLLCQASFTSSNLDPIDEYWYYILEFVPNSGEPEGGCFGHIRELIGNEFPIDFSKCKNVKRIVVESTTPQSWFSVYEFRAYWTKPGESPNHLRMNWKNTSDNFVKGDTLSGEVLFRNASGESSISAEDCTWEVFKK